jgi:hypothetical protein
MTAVESVARLVQAAELRTSQAHSVFVAPISESAPDIHAPSRRASRSCRCGGPDAGVQGHLRRP